jgi:3'-5' exonuclease
MQSGKPIPENRKNASRASWPGGVSAGPPSALSLNRSSRPIRHRRISEMSSVVFDIETIGLPIESFDEQQIDYLLKFAETPEQKEAELQKLALYPLTARIITIAMLNPDTLGGKVYYLSDEHDPHLSDDGKVEFVPGDEKMILTNFWETIRRYDRFITFNGRTFDCPFILIRSAILGIRATRNLMPYRYGTGEHCDLLEQLTFYGASRKFNLDFYCKAFGIRSPKSDGITGLDLAPLFEAGRFRDIARYCLGDVIATAELFHRWNQSLNSAG